ncbi:PP2C family protein-serine/threonine phosphatase [Nocardioides sp. GCM10027113]|uniref:PP2C family protein-serine/threonine phosphatase n=1 Tax=unclassified Nocardioides TaxID=2615069 RepID=UPI003609E3FB
MELQHGAATDVGRVREVNEDAFLMAPPVFVVADGMGGHEGGDVASRIVVEEFARLADEGYDPRAGADAVERTLDACRRRIAEYDASRHVAGGKRQHAGTTVVAALLVADDEGPRWLLANVGDSRAYRLRGGRLEQVSVDHSVVQELQDAGLIDAAEAATHPERHVVTRAIGGSDNSNADYFMLPLPSAERLLLCSDGVSNKLDEQQLAEVLREATSPAEAADRLVAAAVAAGGEDNATAVVVDVVGSSAQQTHGSARQHESLEQKLGALP